MGVYGKPGYYNYDVVANNQVIHRGGDPGDYITDAVTAKTTQFIAKSASGEKPFFVWASYYAPHNASSPGMSPEACNSKAPLPLAADWPEFRNVPIVHSPNYNEEAIEDKPSEISRNPLFDSRTSFQIDQRMRCTYAAMQAVDRGVAAINKQLRQSGIEENTVVIYVSDNGYFFGDHRKVKGKGQPYEEALRVPMLIRAPDQVLGAVHAPAVSQLVTIFDLAPTILDFADATPTTPDGRTRVIDGRSAVPLLRGDASDWPADRAILDELGNGCSGFASLRTNTHTYVERRAPLPVGGCGTTELELYDLTVDPYQLENIVAEEPLLAAAMATRMHRLELCSGTTGAAACE